MGEKKFLLRDLWVWWYYWNVYAWNGRV